MVPLTALGDSEAPVLRLRPSALSRSAGDRHGDAGQLTSTSTALRRLKPRVLPRPAASCPILLHPAAAGCVHGCVFASPWLSGPLEV